MSASTLKLTEDRFSEEILEFEGPALVDFWADWCGPCRAIAPTIDAVAEELQGRAKVGKVDVDANPKLAETFGIRSIPTLIFFQNGVEVNRIIGAASQGELQKKLEEMATAA